MDDDARSTFVFSTKCGERRNRVRTRGIPSIGECPTTDNQMSIVRSSFCCGRQGCCRYSFGSCSCVRPTFSYNTLLGLVAVDPMDDICSSFFRRHDFHIHASFETAFAELSMTTGTSSVRSKDRFSSSKETSTKTLTKPDARMDSPCKNVDASSFCC